MTSGPTREDSARGLRGAHLDDATGVGPVGTNHPGADQAAEQVGLRGELEVGVPARHRRDLTAERVLAAAGAGDLADDVPAHPELEAVSTGEEPVGPCVDVHGGADREHVVERENQGPGILAWVEPPPDRPAPPAQGTGLPVRPGSGTPQQRRRRPAGRHVPRVRRRRRCRASPARARAAGGRAAADRGPAGCRPRSAGRGWCRGSLACSCHDHEGDGGDGRDHHDDEVGRSEDVRGSPVDVLSQVGAVVGDHEDRQIGQG